MPQETHSDEPITTPPAEEQAPQEANAQTEAQPQKPSFVEGAGTG